VDCPVRVLIVDDHPAVRAGIAGVLASQNDVEAVGSAATAADAVAEARRLSPAVAIVDYHLPGRDGLSLTLELKRLAHPPRVLIYSAFADTRLAVGASVAGADGILKKSSSGEELCAAIRNVTRGKPVTLEVSSETVSAVARRLEPEDRPIVTMLMDGVPPRQVAEALGMSEGWLVIRRWAILKRISGERGR
jgi:DNA-binding NarL/FixJ family response regulator